MVRALMSMIVPMEQAVTGAVAFSRGIVMETVIVGALERQPNVSMGGVELEPMTVIQTRTVLSVIVATLGFVVPRRALNVSVTAIVMGAAFVKISDASCPRD